MNVCMRMNVYVCINFIYICLSTETYDLSLPETVYKQNSTFQAKAQA